MDRVFRSADDDTLIGLVKSAKGRLVFIAPALTKSVASAVADRMADLGTLSMTVILDADPEVYRLGYGDVEALDIIRKASIDAQFDLREQQGIRIAIVMSDDQTLIYSPVPRNIEAGSKTDEKPNAVFLTAGKIEAVAEAAGAGMPTADPAEPVVVPEIGTVALIPERIEETKKDLDTNQPQDFDVSRKLRMFSSQVEYVELSVTNYRLSTGKVKLPKEFGMANDKKLRDQISAQMTSPFKVIGPQTINLTDEEDSEEGEVDEQQLAAERKEIEDTFTYVVPKKGRIILKTDKETFKKQIAAFKNLVARYQDAMKAAVQKGEEAFEELLVAEFLERWKENPPGNLKRRYGNPTEEQITSAIKDQARRLFADTVEFRPPEVSLNFKGITYEDMNDPEFRDTLHKAMARTGISQDVIAKLFETGTVAASAKSFKAS